MNELQKERTESVFEFKNPFSIERGNNNSDHKLCFRNRGEVFTKFGPWKSKVKHSWCKKKKTRSQSSLSAKMKEF